MHDLGLTTPAILFPTISLLLLAYTNRYVAISNRIRLLHNQFKSEKADGILSQIRILRSRLRLIRNMQLMGILSMFFAAFTMFLIYYGWPTYAHVIFGGSLVLMLTSLALCAVEIYLSDKALMVQLSDLEHL